LLEESEAGRSPRMSLKGASKNQKSPVSMGPRLDKKKGSFRSVGKNQKEGCPEKSTGEKCRRGTQGKAPFLVPPPSRLVYEGEALKKKRCLKGGKAGLGRGV